MRKVITLLCLSLILIALVPGTSWSQATFDIKIFPSKLELNGDPGSTQQFVINVQNLGAEDQVLRVYFNDYYIKPNNQFIFAKPGHFSYSCANWLSTDTPELAVPAGQTAQKAFALTVPQKAEPGGHYGIIFFEQVLPGGPSVKTVPRIGVVTLVTVPGDIVRKGTITAVQVTSAWFWPTRKLPLLPVKTVHCRVVFRNEGNVHLTIKGKVTYTPTFGWGTGVVEINEMTVLPKTTRYLETDLKNPPFMGSYEATAEVQYGPSLDVYDTVKTKKGSFQVYPLSLLLILLLLLAVIIAPIWIYRRTHYEWVYLEEEEDAEPPPEGAPAPEGVTEEAAPTAETVPGAPVAGVAVPATAQPLPPAQTAAPAQPAPPEEIITPMPPPIQPPPEPFPEQAPEPVQPLPASPKAPTPPPAPGPSPAAPQEAWPAPAQPQPQAPPVAPWQPKTPAPPGVPGPQRPAMPAVPPRPTGETPAPGQGRPQDTGRMPWDDPPPPTRPDA